MGEATAAETTISIFHHFNKHAAASRVTEWMSSVSWETYLEPLQNLQREARRRCNRRLLANYLGGWRMFFFKNGWWTSFFEYETQSHAVGGDFKSLYIQVRNFCSFSFPKGDLTSFVLPEAPAHNAFLHTKRKRWFILGGNHSCHTLMCQSWVPLFVSPLRVLQSLSVPTASISLRRRWHGLHPPVLLTEGWCWSSKCAFFWQDFPKSGSLDREGPITSGGCKNSQETNARRPQVVIRLIMTSQM